MSIALKDMHYIICYTPKGDKESCGLLHKTLLSVKLTLFPDGKERIKISYSLKKNMNRTNPNFSPFPSTLPPLKSFKIN